MIVAPPGLPGGGDQHLGLTGQGPGCAATCTNIGTMPLVGVLPGLRCSPTWATRGVDTLRTSAARPGAKWLGDSGPGATSEAVDATSATPTQPATANSAKAIDLRAD